MEQRWIPVSERMPEQPKENPVFDGKELELYLVTVDGDAYPFRAFWNGKTFTDGWRAVAVVAWMPLPERTKYVQKMHILKSHRPTPIGSEA